jgi:hypothetical protein
MAQQNVDDARDLAIARAPFKATRARIRRQVARKA